MRIRKRMEKCVCCGEPLGYGKRDFVIKAKCFYKDEDGLWENYKDIRICGDCMRKIQEYIKKEASHN